MCIALICLILSIPSVYVSWLIVQPETFWGIAGMLILLPIIDIILTILTAIAINIVPAVFKENNSSSQ